MNAVPTGRDIELTHEIAEIHAEVVRLTQEAGALLRERFDGPRHVEHKGIVDLVTDADRASEALIAGTIRDRFPDHALLAEEGSIGATEAGRSLWRWVVDPLDGTTNFAHRYPHFAVSIAVERDGETVSGAVIDVMRDELFEASLGGGARLNGVPLRVSDCDTLLQSLLATGFPYDLSLRPMSNRLWLHFNDRTQGVRRDGAAALNLCWVAAGRLDGYWERPVQPWDKAAGALIAQAAGALVTGLEGESYLLADPGVIAANSALHGQILAAVASVLGDGSS